MGARIESNNIEQGLKNAVLKMNLNSNVIVKAGAMSLVPLLKSNTPFANTKKHARDHIAVSNVKTDRHTSEKIVQLVTLKASHIVFMQQNLEQCTKNHNCL